VGETLADCGQNAWVEADSLLICGLCYEQEDKTVADGGGGLSESNAKRRFRHRTLTLFSTFNSFRKCQVRQRVPLDFG